MNLFEKLDNPTVEGVCESFYYGSDFKYLTNLQGFTNKELRETFSEYHDWLKENPGRVLEVYRGNELTLEVKYQYGFKYRMVRTNGL